jgi:hypothetical protein
MSATNKWGRRTRVLELAVGCGVVVCLAGAAALVGVPPAPLSPEQPAASPFKALVGQLFGMYGHSGQPMSTGPEADSSEEGPKDPKAKIEMLRKRYPFESLTKRLEYEVEGAAAFAKAYPQPRLTKETLKRMDAVEAMTALVQSYNPRGEALKLLHSDAAEKFIEARDQFGISRMAHVPVPTTVYLELAAAPSRPFAAVREAAPPTERETAASPKEAELAAFHEGGLRNFLDPRGFGFVKDRDHVAGFQGHQFRAMPELPVAGGPPAARNEQWAVIRLQLVSLLKFDRPAVYLSDNLPRMDELKGVPTRPVTPFEDKSLKALREGDDIATETSGDRIRMVGSLRAGKHCLECHEVKRGDLLGAFSWELQRQPVEAWK